MSTAECPSCGFENRAEALFCGSCGMQLGRRCPACGEVVAVGLAYCTACGAETAPSPVPTPSAEERKVVTVLFADLVGSTSRAERLDPEDVRRLLDSFHVRLKGELERFGGTVEKYIGDAVMALFGAPRAHEDDAERAVRSALAVREAIGELNAADPGLGLRIRVGVTTGEAVVNLAASPARGESMAAGDVVNTAARLQAAAPVDGILVDGTTQRATLDAIEYRPADPVRARGKSEEIAVWEVVAPRARLGVDIAFRGGADLVGRERELELLLEALAAAERERSSQLVTLVGVPGIGKSRLLFELYASLHADPDRFVLWRQGRSLPYGEGVSFWALGEMVKSQAGILESDPAEAAEEKLLAAVATVLPEAGEAQWVLAHLRPLVGLGGDAAPGAERRTEAFAAWRRFFEALAEVRPLVLVFEDLHWADEGLLDFVDHLVDWASGVPLLVVCTARPELLERRGTWGGGKRNALTVSLPPLSGEETARLVSALLEAKVLQTERQADLLARAGGNPLYAEEYVRMLAQPGGEEELPLPESVQGIIAARLDTLPPDEKAVVQDAAVIGKVFWVGALAAVAGLGREAVEERLRALERKEFVRRERRSSVASETAYVFRHGLVRDVAYGQIPRARRAEKHRLAAEWIGSLAANREEDLADLVAHHYRHALQFARASGEAVGGLTDRARVALREAGDRAAALNAFRPAASYYDAALELTAEGDPERPKLLFQLGRSRFYGEDEGAEILAEASGLLLDAGERESAAEAQALVGELLWIQGRHDEAFDHFDGSAELLADSPPSPEKAYVLGTTARFLMAADRADEAIRLGGEALAMAEALGLLALQAHALNTVGVARVLTGDLGGLAHLERSVDLDPHSPEIIRGYNNLASTYLALGELERAFALYAEARGAAERFGRPLALRWIVVEQADEHYCRGRWDEAVAICDEIVADAEAGARHLREVDARVLRGTIRLARGDVAGAEEDSARGIEFAREAQDPQILFPALAARARVLAESGRVDEANALAAELLRRWRESPATFPASWLANLASAIADTGRGAELAETGARARIRTRWLDAAVALAEGHAAEARRLYAKIGSQPDEAFASLRAAKALAEAGRRAEADEELERALSFFRRVGAEAYVRRAEALVALR